MYEDPAIVIKPIAVINDSTSVERCPTFAPKAISIRENSLICATVRPAIKPVLFVYLKNPINPITIIGLPIKINKEYNIIGLICVDTELNDICVPSKIKNEIRKNREENEASRLPPNYMKTLIIKFLQ